jgi:hypothetical protein
MTLHRIVASFAFIVGTLGPVGIVGTVVIGATAAYAAADDDFDTFGEISDAPEVDPDELEAMRRTPAYKAALQAARKKHCDGQSLQFPFEWRGEIEIHGCREEKSMCYDNFKLYKPGRAWACGKELCRCDDKGEVHRSPRKK